MSQVTISKSCIRCKEPHSVQMQEKDYQRWQSGEYIQDAAPYLFEGERELLISGICGKCFDEIFADDEEDEDE